MYSVFCHVFIFFSSKSLFLIPSIISNHERIIYIYIPFFYSLIYKIRLWFFTITLILYSYTTLKKILIYQELQFLQFYKISFDYIFDKNVDCKICAWYNIPAIDDRYLSSIFDKEGGCQGCFFL